VLLNGPNHVLCYESSLYFVNRLRGVLDRHNTSRLHHLLGDFLHQTGDMSEALNQYSIALRFGFSLIDTQILAFYSMAQPHRNVILFLIIACIRAFQLLVQFEFVLTQM
jgi:hypothetical protein